MFDTQVYWIHLEEHKDIMTEGYVGVSNNPKLRLWDHKNDSKKNTHVNPHLNRALQKYKDKIIQTIIFVGENNSCYLLEEELRPIHGIGWNINEGGARPPSRKGVQLSKNHKKSIGDSKRGKKREPFTETHKKNISSGKKGIEFTEEHKKKIKEKRKDQVFTIKTRNKLSTARKGKIPNNAKSIQTPIGIFQTITQAAKAHNVCVQTIINWTESDSPTKSEFKYVKGKI
jgi:hypothetical protein